MPIALFKTKDINMRNSSLAFDIQPKKTTEDKIMRDYISTTNVCCINNVYNPCAETCITGEYCITKKPSNNENTEIVAGFEKNKTINCLIRVNLSPKNVKAYIDIEKPTNQTDIATLQEDGFLNQITTSPLCHIDVSHKIALRVKKDLEDSYKEYKRLSDAHKVKVGRIKLLHEEH